MNVNAINKIKAANARVARQIEDLELRIMELEERLDRLPEQFQRRKGRPPGTGHEADRSGNPRLS